MEVQKRIEAALSFAKMDLDSATKDINYAYKAIAEYAAQGLQRSKEGFKSDYSGDIASKLEALTNAIARQEKAAEVIRSLEWVTKTESN